MFNNTFNRRELENIIVCPFKNISHGLKTLKICRKLPKEANIINVLVLFVEHVGKAGQDDFHEGDEQAEDEPDVYHFYIGGPRQCIRDAYEECGEHKERCDIHSHICLKVTRLVGKNQSYLW